MEPLDHNRTRRMTTDEELSELQSFSRHLLAKLDESRNMGQFGQAEIELLRKKLGVVVNAFSAERQKIEGEFNTVRENGDEGRALRSGAFPHLLDRIFFHVFFLSFSCCVSRQEVKRGRSGGAGRGRIYKPRDFFLSAWWWWFW